MRGGKKNWDKGEGEEGKLKREVKEGSWNIG